MTSLTAKHTGSSVRASTVRSLCSLGIVLALAIGFLRYATVPTTVADDPLPTAAVHGKVHHLKSHGMTSIASHSHFQQRPPARLDNEAEHNKGKLRYEKDQAMWEPLRVISGHDPHHHADAPVEDIDVPPPSLAAEDDGEHTSDFTWPLTFLCPPRSEVEDVNVSGATSAPSVNITFRRVAHPFHEGNRTAAPGTPAYLDLERQYHRIIREEGNRCFAEYRGVDYNSGRINDLAQLRGVTLGFCLQMCLQRNDLVHQSRATALLHEQRSTAYQDRLCSGVVYYNWTGICWLKKRLSTRTSVVVRPVEQQSSPMSDGTVNDTLDFGFAGIEVQFLAAGATSPQYRHRVVGHNDDFPRHLIQKHVTDTNVFVLGGSQQMKLTARGTTPPVVDSSCSTLASQHDRATPSSRVSSIVNGHAVLRLSQALPVPLTRRAASVEASHRCVNLTSILYSVLSEHHYITSRMIPALKTWLRDEHVVVLLVENQEDGVHATSERLLAPYLQHYRVTPETVRMVAYLRRNTLRDLERPAHVAPRDIDAFRTAGIPLNAVGRRRDQADPLRTHKLIRGLNVPMVQTKRARDQLEARINDIMDRRSMIQRRQVDQGESRLSDDSGAWKDLPGIHLIFSRFQNYSYYMIIDDDAFIIQHNLRILLNTFYMQHAHPWKSSLYTGVLSVWYQPLDAMRATMTPFIQGGAGILMTHRAMSRVHPHVNQCRFTCDYLPHGDVRLGCCMKKIVGIAPTYETTFWHMHVYRAQGRDGRQHRSMFPVSFHRMKNESMMFAIDKCASDDIARLRRDGFPLSAPVRWSSIEECYRWMRNKTEHEYKFQMEALH